MENRLHWQGYIETIGGLSSCEVREDGIYVSVWINGNLADDVNSFVDLIGEYGSMFYATKQDYKDDITVSHEKIWPQVV